MEFHCYSGCSQIVVLRNDSEEDVLEVGIYQLKLGGRNKLLLHDALYAQQVRFTLELIHTNICRPMNVKVCNGPIYFITLIDDYSQYGYVYLLSHRYEAIDVF